MGNEGGRNREKKNDALKLKNSNANFDIKKTIEELY